MSSTDSWKEFDSNPISHSAAHHLVAIAELLDRYGYARVSDVARMLEITRGSVSVTLKGLKARGLVTEDGRRFLGLSDGGRAIADGIQAKKTLMKRLFIEILGVDEQRADIDTCKIEHLVSNETATAASRLLRFAESGRDEAEQFLKAYQRFNEDCSGDPQDCPVCEEKCLAQQVAQEAAAEEEQREEG